MWRSLTVALLLFVLAQTANALPSANFVDNTTTHSTTLQIESSSSQTSIIFTDLVNDAESEDAVLLPTLNQACASVFSNKIQTTPNYFLVIEFFEVKLSAGLFKHLANPPVPLSWHEQLSHQSNGNRLSGWKDSNTLYTSRLTYHH